MLILLITVALIFIIQMIRLHHDMLPFSKLPFIYAGVMPTLMLSIGLFDIEAAFKVGFAVHVVMEAVLYGQVYHKKIKRRVIHADRRRTAKRATSVMAYIHDNNLAAVISNSHGINFVLPDHRRVSVFIMGGVLDPEVCGKWCPNESAIYMYPRPWWTTGDWYAIFLHELGHAVYNHKEPCFEAELEAELYSLHTVPSHLVDECSALILANLTNQFPRNARTLHLFTGGRSEIHSAVPRASSR